MAGRGRPKGSRNKASLEREASSGDNSALTPQQQEERFHRHLDEYVEADAKVKSAAGAFRNLKGRIKDEGGDIEELKIACQLENEEGTIKQKATLAKIARVSRYMGVPLGTQFELFGQPAPDAEYERGFGIGKSEGLEASPRDTSRFATGTRVFDGYHAGYDAGQAMNLGGIKETPPPKAAKPSGKKGDKKGGKATAGPLTTADLDDDPSPSSVVAFPGGAAASGQGSYADVS